MAGLLILTYDELLEEIKVAMTMLSRKKTTPLDFFERGSFNGAINFWFQLVLKTGVTKKQYNEDNQQLCVLAGLNEPSADAS
ncbi:hypothetical protein [Acinetobacter baumannii]|uniref:hypothetical protein n=1 Tax=Acinetobacter baumannii TaxID=470 RepID=UPI0002D11D8D|nr:hypothetical protein [Acinetobacter baumannii]ENW50309.1 hypothetical protein F917_01745 [Acinetobacter baumannii NIPH 67]MDC4322296.1 hypothetical protein [Acinetobacter baumannii]MDC4446262.1 hypothetical protein [Acinetobacter baumannii]MDC4630296.1 hypothetical protein [Acinetobacter baumannii]MDC4713477.1 hypothetical protein [Acinetobacter baumannii]